MDDDDDDNREVTQSQDPSFLRRLAGASAHKVGYGRDQEEINRQIYEITKGTKYYEHEKRKDAEWNVRIEKILKRRDELLREADITRVEARVDRIFTDMDKKRDLSQSIVHIDMDAFYANVELQHNPDLKDKPFVVVGLGIVTTASYEARKFGCRSGQAEFIAKRLCPDLILVPVDYHRVGAISRKVMGVCREYDPNLHIGGCDEAYLNITEYMMEHDLSAADCVQEIRANILKETNLTASAGIAPNMMLAKICSDKNKPNGQYQMEFTREAVLSFIHALPVRKVPGIGRVGEKVLQALGVETCGDISKIRAILHLMPRKFAVDFLFDVHLGLAPTVVRPAQREERKSVGASRTFEAVDTEEDIYKKVVYIAGLLENDLESEGWAGKVVILTYKLDTFKLHTRQATFNRLISKAEELIPIGWELIKPLLPMRIRLLGLRVTVLTDLRVPQDQGLKRFFEPSLAQKPGMKGRKLDGQEAVRVSEPADSPRKRRRGGSGSGSEVISIDCDDETNSDRPKEEDEEEEITSFDDVDSFAKDTSVQAEGNDVNETLAPDSVASSKLEKYDDIEIPFFRPHNPAVSSTCIIKNGKESATTRTVKPPEQNKKITASMKAMKPITAISRKAKNSYQFQLPLIPVVGDGTKGTAGGRSTSEQPPNVWDRSRSKGKGARETVLPFTKIDSRASTPTTQASPEATESVRGRATSVQPAILLISTTSTSASRASTTSTTSSASSDSRTSKPSLSRETKRRAGSTSRTSILTCPICARDLETDNVGLNKHIDFCLSRGAIKEAREAARSTFFAR